MEGSSYAASVKADPNPLLRTVKALDIEGSDKVNSDISGGSPFTLNSGSGGGGGATYGLPSSLWHTTHSYSSFLTNCLPCTFQNLDLSSVRVNFTPPCITRLWLSLTKRDVM